jgi:uridine phosphorylase
VSGGKTVWKRPFFPERPTWSQDLYQVRAGLREGRGQRRIRPSTSAFSTFLYRRLVSIEYPILEFDSDERAVIEPHMVRDRLGVPVLAVPCFFSDVIQRVCMDAGAKILTQLVSAHSVHPVFEIEWEGHRVAVYHPGVGSPLAGMLLEEIIETGCRNFVAVGGAGGLVPDLTVGHVVVPTSAIRDEGTSYHYTPGGREVEPSPRAVVAIEAVLQQHGVPFVTGKVWTTDAPYRETRGKVERRVAEGCVAVDMEASALFAIARFRGVEFGHLLAAADDLSQEQWNDRGFIPDTSVRERLFWLAVEAATALAQS